MRVQKHTWGMRGPLRWEDQREAKREKKSNIKEIRLLGRNWRRRDYCEKKVKRKIVRKIRRKETKKTLSHWGEGKDIIFVKKIKW